MTISHDEFVRLLPKAINNKQYNINGNKIFVSGDKQSVEISLGEQTSRKLGNLKLPATIITIELTGYSIEEQEVFLQRFDLAYQRGGG